MSLADQLARSIATKDGELPEGDELITVLDAAAGLTRYERLSGQTDGKPKVFRDSAIENLAQFFERFRELNVRSNEQLDELVSHCQHVVAGVEPQS